jgi:hypothetical protein
MSKTNPRDHGGVSVQQHGTPRVTALLEEGKGPACPYCGCLRLAMCEVDVVDSRLTQGHGTGTYMGCPACPWAGPMVTMTAPPAKGDA